MKTIIEMAKEAGLHRTQHNLMSNPVKHRFSYDGYEENLERFAAIVRADEREACAKVCDDAAALAQPDHSCQTTGICALSSTFIELVNVGLPRGTVILRSDKLEAKL